MLQLYTAVIAVFNEGIKRYENFLLLVTTPNCHDGMNLGNDIINHLEQIIEEGPITVAPPDSKISSISLLEIMWIQQLQT